MALRRDGNSNSSASYKPYETANSSFVKRMAHHVTGIIGWRTDSQSENQNSNNSSVDSQPISQNYNDLSHSLADEDNILPAAKRIRVQNEEENTLLQFKPSTSKELRNVCSPIQPVNEIKVAGPSNRNQCITSSTPSNICSSTFRSNSSPVQLGAKNQSPNTSLTGHFDFNLPQFSIHQRHNVTVPSIPRDVPNQTSCFDINKSLSGSFSTTNSRRPSFNVDTFSSSSRRLSLSACENRSRSCISPFYSARTMYGGASALLPYGNQTASRLRSASTSKLDVFSPRSQITMQPVPSPAKSNDQETMSAAARRILDTLEKYCSPVMDAKRIPLNESGKKSVDSNLQQSSRGVKRKLQSLTQMMPSTADLLRLKRTEKMQDSISCAKQIVASIPESSVAADDSSDSSSDSVELDYSGLTDDTKNKRSQLVSEIKKEDERKSDDSPVPIGRGRSKVSQLVNLPEFSVNLFTFSKPLLLEDLDQNVDDVEVSLVRSSTSEEKTPRASMSNTSAFSPKTLSPSSNFKVTAEKVKPCGSVLSPATKNDDYAISQNKQSLPNNLVFENVDHLKKAIVPSWTCTLCFSINIGERCSKCSASRELNTKSVTAHTNFQIEKVVPAITAASTALTSSGWGDQFNRSANVWECKECFVSNKSTDSKCIACQSPKNNMLDSGSMSTSTSINNSVVTTVSGTNDLWKNLHKSTTDSWKCDSCWIQNKKLDMKCAACGAAKESKSTSSLTVTDGLEKETSKGEFSFGFDKGNNDANVANKMKFGIEKPAVNFGFDSSTVFASTATATKPTFSFGVNTATTTASTGDSDVKTTAVEKPAVNFGFGSSVAFASTATATKPTFSFGVNMATTTASNGDSGVKTTTMSSPSQFQFGFKPATSHTVETSVNNNTGFNNMFLNATNKTEDGDKTAVVDNKREMVIFNDVSSSTNNAKNSLLKSGDNVSTDSVFKTPKFVSTVPKSPTAPKENGAEERSSQSVFNDISSSTESPSKRKISSFSSPSIFSKESANGLPNATPTFSITNGATAVSSSSNIFASSAVASPLVSGGAKLTNDTLPSFASITKKEKTFDDKNSGKLFPTNSFGVSSSSSSSNSLFGQLPSSGGFATPKKAEPLTFGAANTNFSGGAAQTFSFGANATVTQPSGGFRFNGPKAEDNSAVTPKFSFGSSTANSTPAFGSAASSPFTFNTQQTSNSSSAEQRSVANSIFATATAKPPQQPNAQPQPPMTNSISAFGNSVFGAPQQPSQPLVNPTKKPGGFNFAAPTQFTTQPMNSFFGFTNQSATTTVVDNQEQNLLTRNTAPTSSAFVFGNPNPAAQSHNFNLTVPPTFNFTGGNSSMAFSAQPTATNAAPAATATRRFKKAVRRTAK